MGADAARDRGRRHRPDGDRVAAADHHAGGCARRSPDAGGAEPLFIIDVAVPRDVDPAVSEIEQVFLYNVDDLQGIVQENLARRGAEIARAEAIVAEEVARFTVWQRSRRAIPTVVALRQRFDDIRRAELQRLEPRLSGLPADARARVEEVTRLIVEKLLLEPTEQLKALPDEETQAAYTEAVNRLFRLGDDESAGAASPSATLRRGRLTPRIGAHATHRARQATAPIVPTRRKIPMASLKLGTRGSQLALFQANTVAALLQSRAGVACDIVVIKTSGDRLAEAPLSEVGGKRLFVKEIEDALLDGRIDLAVHSSKDMPAVLPEGLALGAVLPREDARDAIVLPCAGPSGRRARPRLTSTEVVRERLGPSPRIGTSSVRRTAQLMRLFPGARFDPIRGNLDTRLRKVDAGEYDALVLAAAGLIRLGHEDRISATLPPDACVPAPVRALSRSKCERMTGRRRAW